MRSVINAAARNYGRYEHVCGVSYGSKFTDGEAISDVKAVQFFVSEKVDKKNLKKSLPSYVLERDETGKANRKCRIDTDVIELKNLEMCCLAGDEVTRVGGSRGTITLIFEDQLDSSRVIFLTCSHVASDLSVSPSPNEIVGGNVSCVFQADVLANSTIDNGELEYDIAVGQLFDVPLGQVSPLQCRSGVIFSGFAIANDLVDESLLECSSVVSGDQFIQIRSDRARFENVTTPSGQQIFIDNLIACKGSVSQGDSGGIVYKDDRVVGIVVARADDEWLFIHVLEDAINYLMAQSGVLFRCF